MSSPIPHFIFLFKKYVLMLCMDVCVPCMGMWRPEEGIRFPGSSIDKWLQLSAGNQNWVPWKRSKCPLLWTMFQSPWTPFKGRKPKITGLKGYMKSHDPCSCLKPGILIFFVCFFTFPFVTYHNNGICRLGIGQVGKDWIVWSFLPW